MSKSKILAICAIYAIIFAGWRGHGAAISEKNGYHKLSLHLKSQNQ